MAGFVGMGKTVKVPDTVHKEAKEIAESRDMTIKEAIRYMCREGGYDV